MGIRVLVIYYDDELMSQDEASGDALDRWCNHKDDTEACALLVATDMTQEAYEATLLSTETEWNNVL